MKTIYLCGPINGCTDAECLDWRAYVSSAWPGNCIDPMVRDYRGREAEAFREIVELDKIDVAEADIILVNYDKPSVGTPKPTQGGMAGARIVPLSEHDRRFSHRNVIARLSKSIKGAN